MQSRVCAWLFVPLRRELTVIISSPVICPCVTDRGNIYIYVWEGHACQTLQSAPGMLKEYRAAAETQVIYDSGSGHREGSEKQFYRKVQRPTRSKCA